MYQETNMPWQAEPKNYMALASMILGILSIVTACCFFPGLVLGGLAVFFAALSRVDERLSGQGRTGLITGIMGILLGLVSIVLWAFIGGGL